MSMTEVNRAMQELNKHKLQQWAEQWAEKAIQLRDTNDTDTILSTLNDKNPFDDNPVLMNIMTGKFPHCCKCRWCQEHWR